MSKIENLIEIIRERYYIKLRKKLTNKTPTIIASDCVGGVICHNLNLQFLSPTINLFFKQEDFFTFVSDLQGFLSSEVYECETTEGYPIGELRSNGKDVKLHFLHYKTFKEAAEKWDERKQRVDLNNLYIIQLVKSATEEYIKKFDSLNWKHKLLITNKNPNKSKNVFVHKILSSSKYYGGQIMHYKNKYSIKKFIDKINYVKFLNNQD